MGVRSSSAMITGLVLIFIVVIAGLAIANYRYAAANPGGSDFLPGWVATRQFFTRGISPYSDEVKAEIQNRFYGGPAKPGQEITFVYPLYATLVFAPFALVPDYVLARALWMTALEVGLILNAVLSIVLLRWRTPPWLMAMLLLFSVFWVHGLGALINGNVVILCSVFVTLGLLMIRTGHDAAAGIVLGLATIKPNAVLLLLLFVILWAASHRRSQLVVSMLSSVAFLTVAGLLVLPSWPLQNIQQLVAYLKVPQPGSPGEVFIQWLPGVGRQMSIALTVLLVILCIGEWWSALGKEFRWFLWTACLTLVAGQWIGIKTDPGNFVILFLPLVLVFSVFEERWGPGTRWFILASMILLGAGLWALYLATLTYSPRPQASPVMFFPYPLLLLIALYWVKWWAIHPPRPLLDELRGVHEAAPER